MSFPADSGTAKVENSAAAETAQTASVGDHALSRSEMAVYLAEISIELAALARSRQLDIVAYCLEMAWSEASRVGRADG